MRSRILLFACSIAVLLGACRGEREEREPWLEPAPINTTMPEPQAVPQTAAGTTVVVTVNDGHVATQESAIPQGPAVVTVMNAGKEVHSLHIEGPGVSAALENTLANGEAGTINVTFQQGEYEFYCSVLDHRNNGESLKMTIPTP